MTGCAMFCAALLIATALAGCERPPISANGVVAVFGSVGLGQGAFSYPRAIAISAGGKVYVVDKTARIQRFSSNGDFERAWEMPESAAGKPVGLSIHPDGRVFVADTHYQRVVVFSADGEELARFGSKGTEDGQFLLPTDITFDARGRIYVAEYGGNDRITRWNGDFTFERVLVGPQSGGASLRRPAGIAIDARQTLWVADAGNHRLVRFDLQGNLLGEFGALGEGFDQMRYPYDLDIDGQGHLLVCEYGNNRLHWFDESGHTLRLWGSPGRAVGELNRPWGAATGPDGRVFVVDSLNGRIQIIRL